MLAVMPFAAHEWPALGVSLLKAELRRDDIDCDVAYLNLAFAELVGRERYLDLVDRLPVRALVGEWIFAECLWGPDAGLPVTFVDDVLRARWRLSQDDIDAVLRARELAPDFLNAALASRPWGEYPIVGFSSSAAQNVASLALAQMIKAAHPDTICVFGGANWHGPPGLRLHELFPFVDYACTGEADVALPRLVRWLAGDEGVDLASIPGLVARIDGASVLVCAAEPVADLDGLPAPDCSDFFATRLSHRQIRATLPALSLETSRGCFWAARHACSFCGVNGHAPTYRAKSPDGVVAELRELTARWPCRVVYLADTAVPATFLDEVLPALAAAPLPARLFFEVRPDLTKEQVQSIAAARARIQPGIESLSDHVLGLLRKGTRALENIRLLKWCRAAGVHVHWNLLYGVPGETAQDYDEMVRLFPAIRFLAPPVVRQSVTVDRFSVYFEEPERHGIARLRPLAPYRYVYPFSDDDLAAIAYSFDHDRAEDRPALDVSDTLAREIAQWRREWLAGDLRVTADHEGRLTLRDKRPAASEHTVVLDELESLLYRACDDIGELDDLVRVGRRRGNGRATAENEVQAALAALVDRLLMVRVGDRFLSLALPPVR